MLFRSARAWNTGAFDLCGELVNHCRHGGIGHSILGERESQETTRNLIRGVYEYAPAHRTFNMFVPPSTRPMKPREDMFDHAQCTKGVATVRVRYGHGMCAG